MKDMEREAAIKRLLKDNKELYVVDVILKNNKTGEKIRQWYIYDDIANAENYLALCENYYIAADQMTMIKLIKMDNTKAENGVRLRYRYIDPVGTDISEFFRLSTITRAA